MKINAWKWFDHDLTKEYLFDFRKSSMEIDNLEIIVCFCSVCMLLSWCTIMVFGFLSFLDIVSNDMSSSKTILDARIYKIHVEIISNRPSALWLDARMGRFAPMRSWTMIEERVAIKWTHNDIRQDYIHHVQCELHFASVVIQMCRIGAHFTVIK